MNLGRLFSFLPLCLAAAGSAAAQTPMTAIQTNEPDAMSISNRIARVTAEVSAASARVRQIVNQPVTAVPLTQNMEAWHYESWFHPGASKPDYDTVDIRHTQEFPYDKYKYVYSDLRPGVAFFGRELEFNSMTKIFYTDRSLPKKKLTQAEMVEVNRLYRIIGHGLKELAELQKKP